MIQYADLPMDLADASFVLLAEELGHGRIIFTDRRDLYFQLGNADLEAPASSLAKLELRLRGSQAGAWEPEDFLYVSILLFK